MSLLLLYVFGFYYDSDVSGFYDSDVVPFTLPAVPLMVLVVNILFRLWEYAFDKSVRFAAILSCTIPFVLFLSLLFLSVLFGW